MVGNALKISSCADMCCVALLKQNLFTLWIWICLIYSHVQVYIYTTFRKYMWRTHIWRFFSSFCLVHSFKITKYTTSRSNFTFSYSMNTLYIEWKAWKGESDCAGVSDQIIRTSLLLTSTHFIQYQLQVTVNQMHTGVMY